MNFNHEAEYFSESVGLTGEDMEAIENMIKDLIREIGTKSRVLEAAVNGVEMMIGPLTEEQRLVVAFEVGYTFGFARGLERLTELIASSISISD